jgi:hypothetical protein
MIQGNHNDPNKAAEVAETLLGDHDASLRQKPLDVAQAEAEHVIQPHGMADDLCREMVAVLRVRWQLHAASLGLHGLGRQPRLL